MVIVFNANLNKTLPILCVVIGLGNLNIAYALYLIICYVLSLLSPNLNRTLPIVWYKKVIQELTVLGNLSYVLQLG
jgi:hypothetical protein